MKYTRYNYKNKNNNKFTYLFIFIIIVFLALVIGTLISNAFIKGNISGDNGIVDELPQKSDDNTTPSIEEGVKLYSVQCGFFKDKGNADKCVAKLSGSYPAFIYNDNNGFKVMIGIYEDNKSQDVINKLKGEGINAARVTFDFSSGTACLKEIGIIANADMKIMNKLEEQDVKSVPTADLKKWTKEIADSDDDESQKENLSEIKDFTLSLPDEIAKNDAALYYEKLLNIMMKTKK